MASTTSTSSSPDAAPVSHRSAMPSRNPLPLSAAQEAAVRDTYYKRVRGYCAPEIKAFAECARGRTFTASFQCREQRLAMNTCMIAHDTPAEFDAAREQWFAARLEKQRLREETARDELRARAEQERRDRQARDAAEQPPAKTHNEWWAWKR